MNCHEFESVVVDVARGKLVDAAQGAAAKAHAVSCSRCGLRFADEVELSRGLRAFASSTESRQAGAEVEASLLAAFAREHAAPSPLRMPSARLSAMRVWLPALAASVLIAAASFGLLFRYQQPDGNNVTDQNRTLSKADGGKAEDAKQPAAPGYKNPSGINHTGSKTHGGKRTPSKKPSPRPTTTLADALSPDEIATDFLPLPFAGGSTTVEGGQLLRVELPRVALLSFGLPMNPERAREPIKADVLLGTDGIARAIRFVQ